MSLVPALGSLRPCLPLAQVGRTRQGFLPVRGVRYHYRHRSVRGGGHVVDRTWGSFYGLTRYIQFGSHPREQKELSQQAG